VLTRAGWLVLAAAAALVAIGRFFGIIELYVAAATLVLLAVVSVVYVRIARLRLRLSRAISPTRVHAGGITRVEVAATNLARPRTPVLRLRDPVGGTRGATLHLAPLAQGETARAAYRLPTAHRGVVPVGPLTVEISDPFGLSRLTSVAAPRLEVTVYPHVDDLSPPRHNRSYDPLSGSVSSTSLGRQGDDFYALRQYVIGDDLRRVHWPTTARHDELMVRQDELPFQDRTTVVLDVRRGAHSPETFEAAVSVAASVLTASWRHRDVIHFITTGGHDSGTASSGGSIDAMLEHLAVVEPEAAGSLHDLLALLARPSEGGTLIAVLGRAAREEQARLAGLSTRFSRIIVVTFDPLARMAPVSTSGSLEVIRLRELAEFPTRWDELSVGGRSRYADRRLIELGS
jgi:uncharacterized protein (DUF58 family)